MRYILLPFFLCLLLPTVGVSMAKITLTRVSFLASSVGCLLFVVYVVMFQVGLPVSPTWAWVVAPPAATVLNLPTADNSARYQEEFLVWHQLYQLQPTHRDVLVNLAVLSELLGKTQDHDNYWAEAQHLDPNNALFTSN